LTLTPEPACSKTPFRLKKHGRMLMALQSVGYVKVNSIQSASGEIVEIALTPKGESVVKEFEP
jgi:hypothetical protein